MLSFLTRFVQTYGYDDFSSFLLSIVPSAKYSLHIPAISLSATVAIVSEFLGLTPVLALAMLVAISVEMLTGISASKKRGIKFESFRFSRCIIKLMIWLSLIYIIHAFYKECAAADILFIAAVGPIFFSIVKAFIMVWFCVEHVTSILENLSILDGKPKTALIEQIQNAWSNFTTKAHDKFKKNDH